MSDVVMKSLLLLWLSFLSGPPSWPLLSNSWSVEGWGHFLAASARAAKSASF